MVTASPSATPGALASRESTTIDARGLDSGSRASGVVASTGLRALLSVGLLFPLASGARAQQAAPSTPPAPSQAWTVGERTVPIPAAVSDELRQSIAATPAPDVEVRRQTSPSSDEAWLTMQTASARGQIEQLSEGLGVAIERDEIAGVKVYRVAPRKLDPAHRDHLFLHVHGGAYVLNGGDASPSEAAVIGAAVGIAAISIDYRMPPKHPFPAAIEDVLAVYRKLTSEREPSSIVLGGTSAGGGLALASVHKFLSVGLEPPGAIYAGTPWADLSKTGDSLFTNEGLDRILVTYDGLLGQAALLYADGHDLKDPLLSPVYGSFEGFPPTYLVTGTRDMFLSDTARTHRKLRTAGVVADLNVYEGVSHADYLVVPRSPEAQQVFAELGAFLQRHLP